MPTLTLQDPNETAAEGTPLKWGPPAAAGQPTQITIAIATQNLPADQGIAPLIDNAFPQQFVPLLTAAEEVWETAANIQFVAVNDSSTADIRVGLADLSSSLKPPTMNFIGYTELQWDSTNKFKPDTVVTIQDPTQKPVTALPDGNFQYNGFTTTVFQDLLHEIGHALGLGHNTADVHAIMNPTLTALNQIPDYQDVSTLSQLYGARTTPVIMAQDQYTLVNNLMQPADLRTG